MLWCILLDSCTTRTVFRSQRVEKTFINFIRVFSKITEVSEDPFDNSSFLVILAFPAQNQQRWIFLDSAFSLSEKLNTFHHCNHCFPPLWNQPGSPWCSLFLSLYVLFLFLFSLFLLVFSYLCNPPQLPPFGSMLSSNISPFHFTQYLATHILFHLSFTCPPDSPALVTRAIPVSSRILF